MAFEGKVLHTYIAAECNLVFPAQALEQACLPVGDSPTLNPSLVALIVVKGSDALNAGPLALSRGDPQSVLKFRSCQEVVEKADAVRRVRGIGVSSSEAVRGVHDAVR